MATRKKTVKEEAPRAVAVEEVPAVSMDTGRPAPMMILNKSMEERVAEEIRRAYGPIPEGNVTALLRAVLSELVLRRLENGGN